MPTLFSLHSESPTFKDCSKIYKLISTDINRKVQNVFGRIFKTQSKPKTKSYDHILLRIALHCEFIRSNKIAEELRALVYSTAKRVILIMCAVSKRAVRYMDFDQSISADLNAVSSNFASFRLIVIMPFKGNCIKVQHCLIYLLIHRMIVALLNIHIF